MPREDGTGTDRQPQAQVTVPKHLILLWLILRISKEVFIGTNRPVTNGNPFVFFTQAQASLWAAGQPLPAPQAQSTAPPPTNPSQTPWTRSLT